jgi:hypothetical protein
VSTKESPGQFDCFKKLGIDEEYFVLRAKDPVAPAVVRHWIELRKKTPGNEGNPKFDEAEACAQKMIAWRTSAMSGRTCGCDPGADHKCDHHGSQVIEELQRLVDEARARVRNDVYEQLRQIMVFTAAIEAVIGEIDVEAAKRAIAIRAAEIFIGTGDIRRV